MIIKKLFGIKKLLVNNIIITSKKDLIEVIESPIVITNNESIEIETDCNMWTIGISESLIDKLSVQDLEGFINELLKKRSNQLADLGKKRAVTFYLWFDAQALQLRFNLISSINKPLPFGCELIFLKTSTLILQDFITTTKSVALQEEQVEYINLEDDSDDDDDNFTLNVYVIHLKACA